MSDNMEDRYAKRAQQTGDKPAPSSGSKKGVVSTASLRVRADHSTSSEVVAGLVNGDEVTILEVWTDGDDKWAKLENGWAAIEYGGKTLIKVE